MSVMTDPTQTNLQATVFDFAVSELVRLNRESFQPLWTVDSWVKFLIWMALNCGLSGERESLELFASALGQQLTSRMRKIFFERVLEENQLHVIADPAESNILVMSLAKERALTQLEAEQALDDIGLLIMVEKDLNRWQIHEALVAIPWKQEVR